MAIKKSLEVKLPSLPNFIKVGESHIDVKDFTDQELKSIGKEWTENLLKHAKKRRNS